MDGDRFDRLARACARGGSRRAVLRGALALGLAGGVARGACPVIARQPSVPGCAPAANAATAALGRALETGRAGPVCCRPLGGSCAGDLDCCYRLVDPEDGAGTCGSDGMCGGEGAACETGSDCFGALACLGACAATGAVCLGDDDCPNSPEGGLGTCVRRRCRPVDLVGSG